MVKNLCETEISFVKNGHSEISLVNPGARLGSQRPCISEV